MRRSVVCMCALFTALAQVGCGGSSTSPDSDGGTNTDLATPDGGDEACDANTMETRPTLACGTEQRVCDGDGQWGAWTQVQPDQEAPECLRGEAQFASRDGCPGQLVRYFRCGDDCQFETEPSECGEGCGGTRRTEPRDAEEICVPGGLKERGCTRPSGPVRTCMPRHEVYLTPFYIDRYPVDVRRYQACVAAGACSALQPFSYDDHTFSDTPADFDPLLPVWTATHSQAEAFCSWDGADLPTGAQWEIAATGIQVETEYPGYVEYPYSSSFCSVFPGHEDCTLGRGLPRIHESIYDDEEYPERENSVGIGGIFQYFEWTRDTTGPYPTSDTPPLDPVIGGDYPFEMRGMMAQLHFTLFERDITERNNTATWGDTEHASFRCARSGDGTRVHR
jgi:hypothetical protein